MLANGGGVAKRENGECGDKSDRERRACVCVRVSFEERQEKKGANELDGIWYGIRRGKRKKRVEENTYRYPGSAIPCVR